MVTTGVAVLALLVSAALVALTAALHETSEALGAAVESVRLAEEAEVDLLLHVRASEPLVRRDLERDVRRRLAAAERFVSTPSEARALREAESFVEAYFAAARAPLAQPELTARLDSAFAELEDVVNFSLAQTHAVRDRANQWDRLANVLGLTVSALLLLVTGWVLYWLWARAFQPLFALASTMERFAQGDRNARMVEAGPEELRSMMQRFNALAESLAAQRQAQMAFLAGVAHDLRNPLSALKLSVQGIDPEKPLPPEPRIRRTLSMLERQLTRLERMLGDFLDMTKVEAGELELHPEPHDARVLVQNVAELFDAVSPHRRIETLLPPEPVLIRCDGLRIEQVVSNLVSNALKYSAEDTAILVALRTRHDQAIIEVSDHGPGIPDRELPTLFEPFRRGLAAAGPPGVGLGLFVVRRIVEAHDGRIDVESSPGRGSTFRVCLARMAQRDRTRPAATL